MSSRCHALALALVCVLVVGSSPVLAAGAIRGTVVSRSGAPVDDAAVTLVELRRAARTDAGGTFAFEGIPNGRYLLEVISPRFGSALADAIVEKDAATTVAIRIDLTVHHEDVVVTAGVAPQEGGDVAASVTVLDDKELASKVAATLGETVADQPGVASTHYAPGASRPVIRGLGGDRIRILQEGIGAGDASSVSPDHAVAIDPFSAESVEIVRGPATLLYGSNAIGGVVNVMDGKIPHTRTGERIAGNVLVRYGSNAEATTGAARLGGNAGAFGWHLAGALSDQGNYEGGGGFGTKANSDVESDSWSAGGSWIGNGAWAGAAVSGFDTNYGSAFEDEVRIDLTQRRFDLSGGKVDPAGPLPSLEVRAGGSDYEHVELEGTEIGTRFLNRSIEARFQATHRRAGAWAGSFGAQASRRDFEAIGEEAFVPPSVGTAFALFGLEEIGERALRGQIGLRYERQALDVDDDALEDRDFDALSASAGLSWKRGEDWTLAATLSRSSRVPTAEELYSDGAHVATATYEVGDDGLGLEKSLGLDLTVRKHRGIVQGEVGIFATDFDDFIYERDTGLTFTTDEGDTIPIVRFTAAAARFLGIEGHLDIGLLHTEPHHLELEIRGDYVRAELTDSNEPVPYQPPARLALGLKYQGARWWAGVEGMHAFEQDRFGPLDSATPAYTSVNAWAGWRWVTRSIVHDLMLRVTNIGDTLATNSVSRFRDLVPLPGRDVRATYRLAF